MTKRALAIAAIAAGVLALGGGVAAGCGDKFVLIGGGARVNRSKFPSRVLVFMNPGSRIPAAVSVASTWNSFSAAGTREAGFMKTRTRDGNFDRLTRAAPPIKTNLSPQPVATP